MTARSGKSASAKTDDDNFATAHAKPQGRRKRPGKNGKQSAGKNAVPSAQTLFSKRPNFTSRPSFDDSAAPQRSAKDKQAPSHAGQKKSEQAKPRAFYTASQQNRIATMLQLGAESCKNAKRTRQKTGAITHKSPGSATAKSGLAHHSDRAHHGRDRAGMAA